ncbi:MAG: hypothetical protein AAFQ18_00365 [Pseudomonadota bacterium]
MISFTVAATGLALLQAAPMTEAGKAIAAEETAKLERCIAAIEVDAEAAYEDGLAWLGNGNRPKARHCVALAMLELGYHAEAAGRLEDLAGAPDAGSLETRALYHAQAGSAWLLGGMAEPAIVAFDNALKMKPGELDLILDRASAHLLAENWRVALDDLNTVLAERPNSGDALSLRARAHLALEQFDEALADVDAARAIAPDAIDLLVLRGDIREARRVAQAGG